MFMLPLPPGNKFDQDVISAAKSQRNVDVWEEAKTSNRLQCRAQLLLHGRDHTMACSEPASLPPAWMKHNVRDRQGQRSLFPSLHCQPRDWSPDNTYAWNRKPQTSHINILSQWDSDSVWQDQPRGYEILD